MRFFIVILNHNMAYVFPCVSPKRSRRDGKPETERVPSNTNLDVEDHADRDQKHRRRLQDALPLEASSAPESKAESGSVSKETDKKPNGHHEGSKHSDPTEVPRSRSYYQVFITYKYPLL